MRPPLVLQVKHCASGVCYFLDGTWPAKCPLCGVPWPSRPFESIQTELTAMESMNDGETAVIYSTEESSNSSQQKEISTSSAYSFNSIGSSSTDFTGSSVDSNSSNITTLSYSTNATLSLKTLDWKGVIFKALVSPLVSSESAPKSVLVKTTYGTFLK